MMQTPAKPTILDKTNHLLHLFKHYCGETQIPTKYIEWSLIAGIAACVQDRVWVEKFEGDKLTPNMFIFLLGPSGIGKGSAVKRLLPLLPDEIQTFIGPITGAALNKLLAGTTKKPGNPRLFLIQEELAYCLGHGDMAFDMIKTLTGVYAPTKKMQKATVTGGMSTMHNVCINWLAGTTVEWLVRTLPKEAVKGGFVGRLFPVYAHYNFDLRIPRPIYPHDVEQVREHLMMRFEQLGKIKGPFRLTKKAQAVLDHWYMTRPAPESDDMASIWQRQHDMVYKIAMLFSLCEDYKRKIYSHHVAQAIEVVTQAEEASKIIVRAADSSEDTDAVEVVRMLVARAGILPESALMRECGKRGMSKIVMNRALDQLVTERSIRPRPRKMLTGGTVTWYEWVKGVIRHLQKVK